jgi:hypothetical protein
MCVWVVIIVAGDMVALNNSCLYDQKLTYLIYHHTNGRPNCTSPHYVGGVSQNVMPIGKVIT